MKSAAFLVGSVLLLCTPATAFGQTDQERTAARVAARSGIEAFNDGDYETALDYLTRAESVVHAPTHLLYIARCNSKLGRLVEARESYLKVVNENLSASAPKAFHGAQDSAREELQELEGRMPQLTLKVTGAPRESLTVTINGTELPNISVGLPSPVNPGTNVVVVSAPGKENVTQEISLEEGAKESLAIELKDGTAASGVSPASPATPADNSGGRPINNATYAGLAATGVFAATGTIMGIVALGKDSSYKRVNDGSDFEQAERLRKQASTFGAVADISFGLAITSAVVTTVLYVTRPDAEPQENAGTIQFQPTASRDGLGLSLSGSF